jgi:hypothetical protein
VIAAAHLREGPRRLRAEKSTPYQRQIAAPDSLYGPDDRVQIIGPYLADHTTMAFAKLLEQEFGISNRLQVTQDVVVTHF